MRATRLIHRTLTPRYEVYDEANQRLYEANKPPELTLCLSKELVERGSSAFESVSLKIARLTGSSGYKRVQLHILLVNSRLNKRVSLLNNTPGGAGVRAAS